MYYIEYIYTIYIHEQHADLSIRICSTSKGKVQFTMSSEENDAENFFNLYVSKV